MINNFKIYAAKYKIKIKNSLFRCHQLQKHCSAVKEVIPKKSHETEHNLQISTTLLNNLNTLTNLNRNCEVCPYNFSMAVNNNKKQTSVYDVINEINQSCTHQQISYDNVVQQFGSVPVDTVIRILQKSNSKSYYNLIVSEKFSYSKGNVWTYSFELLWPEKKYFYGIGTTKKAAIYNTQLAAALWLTRCKNLNYKKTKQPSKSVNIRSNHILTNVDGNQNLLKVPQMHQITNRYINTSPENIEKNIKKTIVCDSVKEEIKIGHQSEVNTKAEVYLENEETKKTIKQFPSPKNVLHNIFDILAIELKSKTLKLQPQYKLIKISKTVNHWMCTYHLKWPENITFTAKTFTKQDASHKAAIAALTWLKKNGKITKDAHPIIFGKEEVKDIKTKNLPSINLDDGTLKKMRDITTLFEKEFVPHLVANVGQDDIENFDGDKVVEPDELILNSVIKQQRRENIDCYLAKEKTILPISDYKNEFIDLLKKHQVVIVKGEPGCGKSTRIPQYTLESWAKEAALNGDLCRIAVTQPRRIAAISLAERVSSERDESIGYRVGYQVRFKSNFKLSTGRILYCTTGILLRHFQSDYTLKNFTHVILDEAHERDVNTDLLMNLLRSALVVNPKLKLIVMSATINTDLFKDYFNNAPVMDIPGFTYPVKDYYLNDFSRFDDFKKTEKMCSGDSPSVVHEDVANLIGYIHRHKKEGAILVFLPGWDDIVKVNKRLPRTNDMVVYNLHSRLQDSEQWKIFSRPPPGIRKVILATNIAETSVTIDDVVYVIDTGIHKEQRFDVEKGVTCIDNHWISKASTTQRKGRAGRCQSGECYHFYPKSLFSKFEDYSLPEILRTSLTKIVLDSKVFSNNMNALEFMSKLPCPPEESRTLCAVEELTDLALLDEMEKLTPLGRTLAEFQLEPKLSKAMVNAVIYKCVTPVVDIVSLFSSDTELFMSGLLDKEATKLTKEQFSTSSDHLAMMRLFEKWFDYAEQNDEYGMQNFCNKMNLVPHRMKTIEKLRKLHFEYLYNSLHNVIPISDDCSDNDELVKAVLFSGVGTVLYHRNWDIVKNRLKNVNVLLTRNNQKATITSESVNYKRRKYPSIFLLHINETRSNIRRSTLIRETSFISPVAVLLFSNKLLQIQPIPKSDFLTNLKSEDQVELTLVGTNIKFVCDRMQAEEIIKCKECLSQVYEYFIYQLTKFGEHNDEVNETWNDILKLINGILQRHSVS